MATKFQTQQATEAAEQLREMFPVGSTAATILRHVSSSGMSRAISVMYVGKDGTIRDVSWLVAQVTGFKMHSKHDGLNVGGCGMDMGFHVVYSMSRALYPDGHKCTGTDGYLEYASEANGWTGRKSKTRLACPSNDHTNDYGRLANQFHELHPGDERRFADYHDETSGGRAYHEELRAWMDSQVTYTKRRHHSDGGYAVKHRWI